MFLLLVDLVSITEFFVFLHLVDLVSITEKNKRESERKKKERQKKMLK